MRMTIDIDCTPEEARRLFGLPDVSPINEMIMTEMKKQAQDNLETLANPEFLMAQMMNAGGKGFEQFQQMMMSAMGSGMKGSDKK